MTTETWHIETSWDGRPRGGPGQRWSLVTTGPHVSYGTREEALTHARKLKAVYPHVRLRHDTATFEDVP